MGRTKPGADLRWPLLHPTEDFLALGLPAVYAALARPGDAMPVLAFGRLRAPANAGDALPVLAFGPLLEVAFWRCAALVCSRAFWRLRCFGAPAIARSCLRLSGSSTAGDTLPFIA
jgi:hypothetical protein